MSAVFSEMWSQAGEAPLLTVLLILPTLLSIPLILRGTVLGWSAPSVLVAQIAVGLWYSATDAPNPGLGVTMEIALFPWAIAVVATIAAYVVTWRRERATAGLRNSGTP